MKLSKYINKGYITKLDFFIGLFSKRLVFFKRSKAIISEYKKNHHELNRTVFEKYKIFVEPYDGNNSSVLKMMEWLKQLSENDLHGVYLHGSLGSGEEISYSDFDAIVILKDKLFSSTSRLTHVAFILHKAKSIMMEQDPLQHHGWFVITESDLINYPETYFPSELFRHSKNIFSAGYRQLEFGLGGDSQDFIFPFYNLCVDIENKIARNLFPRTFYELKGLLSEIMLLPAFYVQARDKKGVFKKFSFEIARKDFDPDIWKIMDEVSNWRLLWHQYFSKEKSASSAKFRKMPLDLKVRKKFSKEFRSEIKILIKTMRSAIDEMDKTKDKRIS